MGSEICIEYAQMPIINATRYLILLYTALHNTPFMIQALKLHFIEILGNPEPYYN
jgi:hypothetical protein